MSNKIKRHILGSWVVGWIIFGLVEIIVRIVDLITFPWYSEESLFVTYSLILSAYACLGIFSGFIALLIVNATRTVSVLRFTQQKSFHFAIAQTFIVFAFLIYMIGIFPVEHKLIYLGGAIAACSAIFAVAIVFFNNRLGIREIWWRFIFLK